MGRHVLASASRALLVSALAALTASCTTGSVDPAAKPSWEAVESPPMVTTDEVRTNGPELLDGTYWATAAAVSGTSEIVFHVARVRFGEDCLLWAEANLREDACLNDYGVEEYPEAYAGISPAAVVSVADPAGPGRNFSVDTAALEDLVRGVTVGAPAGYFWVPFPFIVGVRDGEIVEAHQLWVP